MPSFTFVSTANAFVLRGATIVFADSESTTPNLNVDEIEELITEKTKAIVAVHYAGIACDMDPILEIALKHQLYVVEDAAQAIDSFYKGKPLGTFGHLAAFSFHESKNIISGEGGMLNVNQESLIPRAEIIWEKGTNRAALFRGEVDKYTWLDIGSSFLPSDVIAAILYAQLENLDSIQSKRKEIWNAYYDGLKPLEESGYLLLPRIPSFATNNAHMFYVVCPNVEIRSRLIHQLKQDDIQAVFHYLPLHLSPFGKGRHKGGELANAVRFADCLLRLPLYYDLTQDDVSRVVDIIGRAFL